MVNMRRLTRLTNSHIKKLANYTHTVALYTLFYNFMRTRGKLWMAAAMAAGIVTPLLSSGDVLARIDVARAPKMRNP